mmetsp:Transcript_8452/g.12526  ORF Transcript_8452/g.12526 Transcript_8452/m.12526 type:complete len:179 (-) Transcript_8452:202-738(-)
MSRQTIAVFSAAVVLCQTCDALSVQSDRRSFLTKAAGAASSLAVFGIAEQHDRDCGCASCKGGSLSMLQHDSGCNCVGCSKFGVQPAKAFYERDAGDETSSAVTKALNAQARQTNARLEASGFALDTKEEEEARISDAFKTFSYDASMGGDNKKQGKAVGRGYANAKKDASTDATVKK